MEILLPRIHAIDRMLITFQHCNSSCLQIHHWWGLPVLWSQSSQLGILQLCIHQIRIQDAK